MPSLLLDHLNIDSLFVFPPVSLKTGISSIFYESLSRTTEKLPHILNDSIHKIVTVIE